jgi:hypothetical protein
MPTQSKCSHCDPPGSGHCKDSQTTAKSGNGKCQTCYGTGKCRYCNGMGLEMSALEKAKETLLSLWWISWFGIIGGFLWVGVWEYRIISPQRGVSPRFSLTLLIVTSLLWVVFYAVEAKARARVDGAKKQAGSCRPTHTGRNVSCNITLMGILFFIYIAPRVQ